MCDWCGWQEALEFSEEVVLSISESIEEDDFDEMLESIIDILDWISENDHVTPRQLEKLDNYRDQLEFDI